MKCALPRTDSEIIKLGHGSGGKLTASLIEEVFLPVVGNPLISKLDDAALLDIKNARLALTTDAFVVTPIFFPGGNIGSLAVHGTVNDLAMRGARPLFITASFIMEEGLPISELKEVIAAFHDACKQASVQLAAADTKVVNKGAADKLFITTSGVGVVEIEPPPGADRARPGDCILVSGDIGRHGVAIMSCREGLDLETAITSDSCSLHGLVEAIINKTDGIHCLRDITRGGLAGVLNELAAASNVGMKIDEELIPIHPEVRAVCELLGLDPLYVACEGRLVAIVTPERAQQILSAMQKHPQGAGARIIGEVTNDRPGRVAMRSRIGGMRIVDKLSGEQLPRIC